MNKKWIPALIVAGVFAVSAGAMAVRAYYRPATLPEPGEYPYYPRMGGGMGGPGCLLDEDDLTYEFLYARLDATERDAVDRLYAEKLATYDFSTMTDAEKDAAIQTVKDELVTYILDNDMVPTWVLPQD